MIVDTITESMLMAIRLHARHSGEPLDVDLFTEEGFYPLDQAAAEAAHAEGLAARASGMRCMCRGCEVDGPRITSHERLRGQYERRRFGELTAQGLTDEEASQCIAGEIARGAALAGTTHDESSQ